MSKRSGFSLVELIVVVSVLGILASLLLLGMRESGQQSRDTQRRADLRELQSAVELYKNRFGRYPEGCRAAGTWSGEPGTAYACPDGSNSYILGSTGRLFSSVLPSLPVDPRRLDTQSGYVYTTNAEGTVYKIMARRTVESEIVTDQNPFKSCAVNVGICDGSWTGNNTPPHCQSTDTIFRSSYAVWGGFANGTNPIAITQATAQITCNIP